MKIVCPNCRKIFDITFQCVQCGEVFFPRVRYPHYDEHLDEMSEQDKRLDNSHSSGL